MKDCDNTPLGCKVHRLSLGEPCDYRLVEDTIRESIGLWNDCVESLRARLQNPEQLLELLDRECDSSVDDASMQMALKTITERITQLKTINISPHVLALRTLGL